MLSSRYVRLTGWGKLIQETRWLFQLIFLRSSLALFPTPPHSQPPLDPTFPSQQLITSQHHIPRIFFVLKLQYVKSQTKIYKHPPLITTSSHNTPTLFHTFLNFDFFNANHPKQLMLFLQWSLISYIHNPRDLKLDYTTSKFANPQHQANCVPR